MLSLVYMSWLTLADGRFIVAMLVMLKLMCSLL
jgi:hypothetical protein